MTTLYSRRTGDEWRRGAWLLVAMCVFAVGGCTSDTIPVQQYRGSGRSDSIRAAGSIVRQRPASLVDHVVKAGTIVRSALGDSALADPSLLPRVLDSITLKLSSRLFMVTSPSKVVGEINKALFTDLGLTFDKNQSDVRTMFPHTVLTGRKGSCVGLSLLYLLVAERLEAPVAGVLVPQHFFVRYHGVDTTINVETIKGGECLADEWYRSRYKITSESPAGELKSLGKEEIAAVLYYNIGNVLREREKFAEAAQCYQKSVKSLPWFAEAWGNLGVTLEAMGDSRGALDALSRARDIDHSLANLSKNIGAIQLRLAGFESAVSEYREALAQDSTDADVRYGLALALFRVGEYAEGERHARNALVHRPSMAEAKYLLEKLQDAATRGASQ